MNELVLAVAAATAPAIPAQYPELSRGNGPIAQKTGSLSAHVANDRLLTIGRAAI